MLNRSRSPKVTLARWAQVVITDSRDTRELLLFCLDQSIVPAGREANKRWFQAAVAL